ncbi:hypothetical protein [Pseudoramibacter alactolyticus]|jgi:hypothetical protein|uniref:hypothetical protein n=1 Tax=Pseudoramibacter alactolyticus TaxID=113287 RepID=UPI0023527331|nr:hypothetical protein [Pseudoramibacter alactolyticus]MBM6968260.1 hypothetical protein [Pseudoramibacter alactolyticus]
MDELAKGIQVAKGQLTEMLSGKAQIETLMQALQAVTDTLAAVSEEGILSLALPPRLKRELVAQKTLFPLMTGRRREPLRAVGTVILYECCVDLKIDDQYEKWRIRFEEILAQLIPD